jgi:hypothetical protein
MSMDRYTKNKAVIRDVPMDDLRKLFEIFDDLGCSVEYSRDLGELIITIGKTFELELTADPEELKQIAEDKYWIDDAERVAEGYWRQ